MTHTKEPWEVQPAREDGALLIIGSNLGGLVGAAHGWPTEIESGDYTRIEANARRIVACVNALAGIPDPAVYVAAMDACVEAAAVLWRMQVNSESYCLADVQDATDRLGTALQSARAAKGDV